MEERLKLLMVVSSFQAQLDSDMDDERKRGDNGWGVTRKPRERWWGQVRKTLYVIVPEIILNARGLGSDL